MVRRGCLRLYLLFDTLHRAVPRVAVFMVGVFPAARWWGM